MTNTGPRRTDRLSAAVRRSPLGRLGLSAVLGATLALATPAALTAAGATTAQPPARVVIAGVLATQVIPLADKGKGDARDGFGKPGNGRISFGLQPAGPKAVDKRPDFTYRNLKPGQRFVDHVAVVNVNTAPLTVDVYPADAFNTPQGGFDVLTPDKRSKDLGSWIHLGHGTAQVPARSTLIMAFEVRVPENVEPGDHAAGIVASLTTQSRDKKGNIVAINNRTGMRVYARVDGALRPRLELERHEASYLGGLLHGKADVRYTLKNTGNVRLVGTQSIRVSNLFGMSTAALDLPAMPELLPGSEFTFTRPVNGVLPTFLNTAFITVDPVSVTGNVDPALEQVSAKTTFFALSWPGLLLLLALLGGGGWFLVRAWRRRRSAAGPSGWGDGDPTKMTRDRRPPRGGPDGGGPNRGGPNRGGPNGGGPNGGGPNRGAPNGSPMPGDAGPRESAGVARRVAGAFAVVLGAALAVVPTATAAHADAGTLTFIPGHGTAGTPIYAITSGPCPKEGTNLVGYVTGHGFPAGGAIALANQSAPVNHDGPFGVELRDNMLNIAHESGVTLQGPYRITMKCIDNFNLKSFAEFSGTVTFDTPDHFTAGVPAKPPVAGVPVGYLALVFPEYRKVLQAQNENLPPATERAAAGAAASSPAIGGAATEGSPAAQGIQESRTDSATARHSTNGGNTGWLIVAGIAAALIAFAGVALVRQRRPAATAPATKVAAVAWPEDAPTVRSPANAPAVIRSGRDLT